MLEQRRAGRHTLFGALTTLIALLASNARALEPPKSFVMAEDGTTKLSLEEAGILKPDGRRWALALGKALFWDQQAGSDGMSCANCHFVAGADTRIRNALSPGINDITVSNEGDTKYGSTRSDTGEVKLGRLLSGALARPNYELKPEDTPLHRLLDERNRNSPIRTTTNDRVASPGTFGGEFDHIRGHGLPDSCELSDDPRFRVGHDQTRGVEPRNSPSTFNAAFFHRNFWDSRANNLFNGVGVFGMRDILGDPDKRLIVLDHGKPMLGFLRVENASLASQSVAPPVNGLEMSCNGRNFADVGRRLLNARPLFGQRVSSRDSVLGPYAAQSGMGLAPWYDYQTLIRKAFNQKYWNADDRYRIVRGKLRKDRDGYTQMETNFSMFWGLAIMIYEQTLIADRSEFDTQGVTTPESCFSVPLGQRDALWARGCQIFFSGAGNGPVGNGIGGNCSVCHGGTIPDSGTPAVQAALAQGAFIEGQTFSHMIQVPKNEGGVHRHDNGFMSIGLRPSFTDLMTGGTDPYGNPLSFVRQYQDYVQFGTPILDPSLQRAVTTGTGLFGFVVPGTPGAGQPAPTLGTDGAAKAPILRNVALTPPYFSWGGYATLRQAMKFYNRGGNRRDITAANHFRDRQAGTGCTSGDDTGTGADGNQPYTNMGSVHECNTNTTGTVLPLNLLDCDPEPGTGRPPAACTSAGKDSSNDDLAALVRFLRSLTDPRAQCDAAPFDHPELMVLAGHRNADWNHDGKLDDLTFTLPAVGANGYSPYSGYCIPNAGDLFAPGMQARSGGPKAYPVSYPKTETGMPAH